MDDSLPAGSGCTGPAILAVTLIVLLAMATVGVLGLTERITAHQATAAQMQAQVEREQTAQTRIVEDAHTERWQSFLVAMRATGNDWGLPLALLIGEGLVLLVVLIKDRKR